MKEWKLLQTYFTDLPSDPDETPQSTEGALRWLAEEIQYLIDTDFNRLLSLLYRMDVGEERVRKALEQAVEQSAAEVLANLVWERAKEKLAVRKRIEQEGTDWIFSETDE